MNLAGEIVDINHYHTNQNQDLNKSEKSQLSKLVAQKVSLCALLESIALFEIKGSK
jgi:hypothetical protein